MNRIGCSGFAWLLVHAYNMPRALMTTAAESPDVG